MTSFDTPSVSSSPSAATATLPDGPPLQRKLGPGPYSTEDHMFRQKTQTDDDRIDGLLKNVKAKLGPGPFGKELSDAEAVSFAKKIHTHISDEVGDHYPYEPTPEQTARVHELINGGMSEEEAWFEVDPDDEVAHGLE